MVSLLLLNENIIDRNQIRANISATKGMIISINNLKTYKGYYSIIITSDYENNAKFGVISNNELGGELGPSDIDYNVASICFARMVNSKTDNPSELRNIVYEAIREGERQFLESIIKDALNNDALSLWVEDGKLYFSCGNSWFMVNCYVSDSEDDFCDEDITWSDELLKSKEKVSSAIVAELLRVKETNGVEYSCFIDAIIDDIHDSLYKDEIDDIDD